MKQIITKFDDETGDFDVVTPIPFTLNDGIEVLGMMVANIPKYEDTETYNVFDLIRENKELKGKLKATKEVGVEHLKKEIELKAHQKEFIEWLEAKIKNYELPLTDENKKALGYTLPMKGIYKEVLEKYKELIGDNNVKDIA